MIKQNGEYLLSCSELAELETKNHCMLSNGWGEKYKLSELTERFDAVVDFYKSMNWELPSHIPFNNLLDTKFSQLVYDIEKVKPECNYNFLLSDKWGISWLHGSNVINEYMPFKKHQLVGEDYNTVLKTGNNLRKDITLTFFKTQVGINTTVNCSVLWKCQDKTINFVLGGVYNDTNKFDKKEFFDAVIYQLYSWNIKPIELAEYDKDREYCKNTHINITSPEQIEFKFE